MDGVTLPSGYSMTDVDNSLGTWSVRLLGGVNFTVSCSLQRGNGVTRDQSGITRQAGGQCPSNCIAWHSRVEGL